MLKHDLVFIFFLFLRVSLSLQYANMQKPDLIFIFFLRASTTVRCWLQTSVAGYSTKLAPQCSSIYYKGSSCGKLQITRQIA